MVEQQLALDWKEWGGARRGAGPKRRIRSRVAHRTRERLSGREPLHVTTKLCEGLPSLRSRSELLLILAVFRDRCASEDFRLAHFSVQANHLHLLVEASNRRELTRALRGLFVSLARRLNRLWRRVGQVFRRAHEHVLYSPREVRNSIRYVLENSRHHNHRVEAGKPDPHSSEPWSPLLAGPSDSPKPPIARARTWLLGTGSSRAGPQRTGA